MDFQDHHMSQKSPPSDHVSYDMQNLYWIFKNLMGPSDVTKNQLQVIMLAIVCKVCIDFETINRTIICHKKSPLGDYVSYGMQNLYCFFFKKIIGPSYVTKITSK